MDYDPIGSRTFSQGNIQTSVHGSAELYLDLLKNCLTRILFPDRNLQYDLQTSSPTVLAERVQGRDWPTDAETMVGLVRLNHLQACIVDVLQRDVKGDLLEAGVWRGGASILMRAVLKAYGDDVRRVWLADSFEGLPEPNPALYPADAGDRHYQLNQYLAVPIEDVKAAFRRYGLLDEHVRFLPGCFKDTLPNAPVERIAVLRLDGDMYESTMQALESLYHKVSDGGYVIIDDYGALANCRAAVGDFRRTREITDPIFCIDWTGAFWQKGWSASSHPMAAHTDELADESKVQDVEALFNEELYLRLYPDVANAVRQGDYASGKEHFLKYGKLEGRRFC